MTLDPLHALHLQQLWRLSAKRRRTAAEPADSGQPLPEWAEYVMNPNPRLPTDGLARLAAAHRHTD